MKKTSSTSGAPSKTQGEKPERKRAAKRRKPAAPAAKPAKAKIKTPQTKKATKPTPIYRTQTVKLPFELAPAIAALSRHARDLHNTALYATRQIRYAFAWDKEALGRSKIHADANGAFNSGRKACPLFGSHARLSSKHELWGFSPRGGFFKLSPFLARGPVKSPKAALKSQEAKARKRGVKPCIKVAGAVGGLRLESL